MSKPRTELDALLERVADVGDWDRNSVAMDCLRMLPDVAREHAEARAALESSRAAHARCIQALYALQDGCQCACTPSERDSGHHVDCWKGALADPSALATEEWLRAERERAWEAGRRAASTDRTKGCTRCRGLGRISVKHGTTFETDSPAERALAWHDVKCPECSGELPNPYAKR